jgi:hypothetical protein
MGSVSGIKQDVVTRPGRFRTIAENLQAKEVIVGEGVFQRRYILCCNPREAQRERKHRGQVVKEPEEELKAHADCQATARWAIDLPASGRYKRYLTIDKQGRIRLDREAVQQASKHDGKWVLHTDDDTITVDDAAAGYKGLLVIERAFKTLKNARIKMEPMFHWLPKRIQAHVKLCVFSLLIERAAELECKQPWSRIQETLSTLQATEFQTPKNLFFQRNQASSELVLILKSLKIPVHKTILEIKSAPSETWAHDKFVPYVQVPRIRAFL